MSIIFLLLHNLTTPSVKSSYSLCTARDDDGVVVTAFTKSPILEDRIPVLIIVELIDNGVYSKRNYYLKTRTMILKKAIKIEK